MKVNGTPVMKYIILIIVIYLGFGGYLYVEQRNFIYFPVKSAGYNQDEDVFENEGHKIKVSVLNRGHKKAIIYFGGNAEDVDYNADGFSKLFQGYTAYLVKYRGYGGSTGEPRERAIYSDAIHIFEEISNKYDELSIVGRSLGSAVATYVASKKNIHKLILITPFDSILNVAQSQFPIYPMWLLLKDKHNSIGRVKNIGVETLIIAAEKDSVIDISHTERLVKEFPSEIEFHVIKGADHNNISSYSEYYGVLNEFMGSGRANKAN